MTNVLIGNFEVVKLMKFTSTPKLDLDDERSYWKFRSSKTNEIQELIEQDILSYFKFSMYFFESCSLQGSNHESHS